MSNSVRRLIVGAAFVATVASFGTAATATPLANALAIKNAAPAAVETVQWRRGWGWGGVGAGIVAGAIIGGAIASSPYYGYGPYPYYYAPPPAVYGPPAAYGPPPAAYGGGAPVAGDAAAYCAQRYRSYDPASGTFLGYDGVRHPCP
jgi:BA14K-like protein